MAEKKVSGTKQRKGSTCEGPRENVRCRVCRVVDGYVPNEDKCRFCGAKLFKGDVL